MNTQSQPVNTSVEMSSTATAIANDETSNASFCNRTVAKILPSRETIISALAFTATSCVIGFTGAKIAIDKTEEEISSSNKNLTMLASIASSATSGLTAIIIHKFINYAIPRS